MVFALVLERIVWGTTPPAESLFGSALIIWSAIWVSLQKNKPVVSTTTKQKVAVDEESSPLLRNGASAEE